MHEAARLEAAPQSMLFKVRFYQGGSTISWRYFSTSMAVNRTDYGVVPVGAIRECGMREEKGGEFWGLCHVSAMIE